jgi:hypothetical protein
MDSLSSFEIQRRKELTTKLQTRVLNPVEANELQGILKKEKTKATSLGDLIALFAILYLSKKVIDYLDTDDDSV